MISTIVSLLGRIWLHPNHCIDIVTLDIVIAINHLPVCGFPVSLGNATVVEIVLSLKLAVQAQMTFN